VPPLPFWPVAQVVQQPQLHSAAPATRPNVNKVLRITLWLPAMPYNLPKTMKALLEEHTQNNLTSFDLAPKNTWSAALKLNFNKWQYLYRKIVEQVERLPGDDKLKRAAVMLDHRGNCSVSKFYESLRCSSPSKTLRKRKTPALRTIND
jgi:hypothetical protein